MKSHLIPNKLVWLELYRYNYLSVDRTATWLVGVISSDQYYCIAIISDYYCNTNTGSISTYWSSWRYKQFYYELYYIIHDSLLQLRKSYNGNFCRHYDHIFDWKYSCCNNNWHNFRYMLIWILEQQIRIQLNTKIKIVYTSCTNLK